MQLDSTLLFTIIIFVFIIVLIILQFKAREKKQSSQLEHLKEEVDTLNIKLLRSEEKLLKLGANSSKTSFIQEQIKKIEFLELEVDKQKKRVNDAKSIAQEASMIKYDFLSNIRHEVRTPMNSILVFAELLIQELKDSTQLTYANNIFQSGHKLLGLLDKIIELSKIESGAFEIEESAVDVRSLFEGVVHEQKALADKKGLDLFFEIDEKLPDSLMLDAPKVEDILTNIIHNAIKFTQEGYVKIRVLVESVDVAKNTLNLSISIEDTGMGIELKNQEKIFEIFEKRENCTDIEFQGTGLGLSINKKMANLMNGNITLKSELNKGSTFKFLLSSVEIVLSSADDEVSEDSLDFSLLKPGSQVMIVEELEETRNRIITSLIQSEVKVFAYDNLRDAIETLKSKKINLIFIDIDILNIDDGAVSKVIAKMTKASVVILTSTRLKNIEFLKGGVKPVGYLKKPISKTELFKISLKVLNSQFRVSLSNSMNEKSPKEISSSDILKYTKFLEVHAKGVSSLYTKALATNDLNAMKIFAQELLKLSTKYELKEYIAYAKELLGFIELFDIDAINRMMSEYKSKLKRTQNLV